MRVWRKGKIVFQKCRWLPVLFFDAMCLVRASQRERRNSVAFNKIARILTWAPTLVEFHYILVIGRQNSAGTPT